MGQCRDNQGKNSCDFLSANQLRGQFRADKDSDRRQREAIQAFGKRAGYELVDEFNDAAVSGADPIESRPGFAAMLERIAGNGVRTIIVETASRFARDLMVQEVGFARLQQLGVTLIGRPLTSRFQGWPDCEGPE
jgi:DNA invertase Pin-like site-specific DNA recombinase